jgi:transcriptional regulator with XRE-family HTH domain
MDVETNAKNARKRSPEADAFAAQLRAERAAANMSQDDLARVTGVSKPTIARIETGVRVMDTTQLATFCRAFGITMGTFALRAEGRLHPPSEPASERAARRA